MASVEEGSSSSKDEAETTLNDDLPRGSKRDVIEYYFYRGLMYRHITLMLEKQHNITMNQRTLKRRLKDYGPKRRETLDDELKQRVRDLILQEIFTGPDSLNGYRTMWHVLRQTYRINVPRRLVESLLREVDPRGVEHRKSRCLQRRTHVSPGPNFC